MKAYIISDKEYKTELFDQIHDRTLELLRGRGFEIEETRIGKGDLAFCMGCFGCWVKTPGECAIKDLMKDINSTYMMSDVVVYLCPIVFGQFSTNIKNALDRWIPNILPFFEIRKDGSTMHPARYKSYPRQIILAYADDLSKEDAQLFTDISKKHRNAVNVITYSNSVEDMMKSLDKIDLKRAGATI